MLDYTQSAVQNDDDNSHLKKCFDLFQRLRFYSFCGYTLYNRQIERVEDEKTMIICVNIPAFLNRQNKTNKLFSINFLRLPDILTILIRSPFDIR